MLDCVRHGCVVVDAEIDELRSAFDYPFGVVVSSFTLLLNAFIHAAWQLPS